MLVVIRSPKQLNNIFKLNITEKSVRNSRTIFVKLIIYLFCFSNYQQVPVSKDVIIRSSVMASLVFNNNNVRIKSTKKTVIVYNVIQCLYRL